MNSDLPTGESIEQLTGRLDDLKKQRSTAQRTGDGVALENLKAQIRELTAQTGRLRACCLNNSPEQESTDTENDHHAPTLTPERGDGSAEKELTLGFKKGLGGLIRSSSARPNVGSQRSSLGQLVEMGGPTSEDTTSPLSGGSEHAPVPAKQERVIQSGGKQEITSDGVGESRSSSSLQKGLGDLIRKSMTRKDGNHSVPAVESYQTKCLDPSQSDASETGNAVEPAPLTSIQQLFMQSGKRHITGQDT